MDARSSSQCERRLGHTGIGTHTGTRTSTQARTHTCKHASMPTHARTRAHALHPPKGPDKDKGPLESGSPPTPHHHNYVHYDHQPKHLSIGPPAIQHTHLRALLTDVDEAAVVLDALHGASFRALLLLLWRDLGRLPTHLSGTSQRPVHLACKRKGGGNRGFKGATPWLDEQRVG